MKLEKKVIKKLSSKVKKKKGKEDYAYLKKFNDEMIF